MTAVAEEILASVPTSLGALLEQRVAQDAAELAYRYPVDGTWVELTWTQAKERVDHLAAGLLSLGLTHEQRVALMSATRIEWILFDLAINTAGLAVTTVYPNSTPGEVSHIVTHSDSKVLVVENTEMLAVALKTPALVDQVTRFVLLDGTSDDQRVLTFDELMAAGRRMLALEPDCVRQASAATDHGTLATLIYTSGTTGVPKGVELTHSNWLYVGEGAKRLNIIQHGKHHYLWLPMSHVFGKALLVTQLSIGYVMVVDGRPDQIMPGLQATHPWMMCAVPRVFEKVRNAVMTGAAPQSLKGRITRWAFAVGRESRDYRVAGKRLPGGMAAKYRLADRLVFSKLKEKMGGNIEFFVSGSAKLSSQVQDWFYSAGITVVEGYGMTETSAIACVDLPNDPHFGTVGRPLPGTEVRIAADGEILLKGPGIMRGYHREPELTTEILQDGWLCTGDIGHLDAQGYLRITDRKKDLMKTSSGKYVAPQKVENAVTANIPYVSQAVAIGDGRKYVSALITLDPIALGKWAARHKKDGLSHAELTQLPELRASIDRFLGRANAKLEPWETVKKYVIMDHEFSVDDGTTTPSMKVRRTFITDRYRDLVESLYDQED